VSKLLIFSAMRAASDSISLKSVRLLAKLALDVFDSAGELFFADQCPDVRDAQSA
jgi:hypothetical protein